MKLLLLPLFACALLAQTAQPAPAGVAVFGSYNQLGSPRLTMGIAAIYPYPVVGSAGVYGSTTADVYPKLTTDPSTGRRFYAVSASMRQGVHKKIAGYGKLTVLMGGDVGPSFGQAQPSGINVNISTSCTGTLLYKLNPTLSVVLPMRMLYIPGAGWNPVVQMGVVISLAGSK